MTEKEKIAMVYGAGFQDGVVVGSLFWMFLTGVILMAAFL